MIISERRETLEKQVEFLVSGNIPVVFFPLNTRVDIPPLPDDRECTFDHRGVFYYNPYIFTAQDIVASSLEYLLGHVQSIEQANANRVPLIIQAYIDGILVQDSAVDSCDEDVIDMQSHILKCRFPGCVLKYKLPEQVLQDRLKGVCNGS